MNKRAKPELLAPAGDLEKLRAAVAYGADAVYMGGKSLGLRAKAKNFDFSQMAEGVNIAHKNGAKVYITANIFAHEDDFDGIGEYFKQVQDTGADALIISDPGIFAEARKAVPDMEIHISTQANNTNFRSALFWKNAGAKRVVLARELSFDEIKKICAQMDEADPSFSFEVFVHGAMCVSYSGRCLLSGYMAGRDSNRGECAHPCRWKYALVEEKRPGEFYPIYEDERGAYILNSKDLCMIGHMPLIVESGVKSLKIEGRIKSPYYVASVTKAYREAIDDYFNDKELYLSKIDYYLSELKKASHRAFTTGFYFNKPAGSDHIYTEGSYTRNYDFIGVVTGFDEKSQMTLVEQRNKFSVGDTVEILMPKGPCFTQEIKEMYKDNGEAVTDAPHPMQKLKIPLGERVPSLSILRKLSQGGQDEN